MDISDVDDGIVYERPVLGRPLHVRGRAGRMLHSDDVIACEFRVVERGDRGDTVQATMIHIKTMTLFERGFRVYPARDTLLPKGPFRDHFRNPAGHGWRIDSGPS